jgi:hypothetical protein
MDHVLPAKVSFLITIFVILVLAFAFMAEVYLSAAQVVTSFARKSGALQPAYSSFTHWLN